MQGPVTKLQLHNECGMCDIALNTSHGLQTLWPPGIEPFVLTEDFASLGENSQEVKAVEEILTRKFAVVLRC